MQTRMTSRTLSLATLLVTATTMTYAAHHPKIDAELEGQTPDAPLNVIIQYKQGASQRNVDWVTRHGGRFGRNLDVVRSSAYSVLAKDLADLANDPDVEMISPDRPVFSTGTMTPDFKLPAANADIAEQSGWTGAGVGVAVIDSGIQDRPDLHGSSGYRVVYAENFLQGGSAVDQYGHGGPTL